MNCNSNTAPLLEQSTIMSCNNGCTPKDINVICKKIIMEAGIDYVVFRLDNWANFKIVETKDWKI